MQSEKWAHVKDVFDAVLRHTSTDRAHLLDELCGNDHDLRREVRETFDDLANVLTTLEWLKQLAPNPRSQAKYEGSIRWLSHLKTEWEDNPVLSEP